MQYKFFNIPVFNGDDFADELNIFLRTHKVVDTEKHLLQTDMGTYWCISVSYIQSDSQQQKPVKVDYMKVLEDKEFAIFSKLRVLRKTIADSEGLMAFQIFADADLATMAKLEELSAESLKNAKGVNADKLKKWGNRILTEWLQQNN